MPRTIINFHANIVIYVSVTYKKCACLYQTVNMLVFVTTNNENNYPKRESTHSNVQSCP